MMLSGGTGVMTTERNEALWLNPAALSKGQGFGLHYADALVEASDEVYTTYAESAELFQNFTIDSVNALMGKNIYMRGQYAASFLMGPLALGVIVDGQNAFYSRNTSLPQITVGYQVTNGFQLGFGQRIPLRGSKAEWSVGASFKYLFRRGGYSLWGPAELLQLGQGLDLLKAKTGGFENGMGLDLGTQYWVPVSKKFKWGLGASWTEAGGMSFGGLAADQPQNLSVGGALAYENGPISWKLEYNVRELTASEDFAQKQHLGLEVGLPAMKFMLGYNQAYFTYGASFDVWLASITAGSYSEEIGTLIGQNANRRYLLAVDLKFDF